MTRKVKPPESPADFLKLSPQLQCDRITKAYLEKCTDSQLFVYSPQKNRKVLCGEYYAIKRFLMKNQESLVLLWVYLCSLEEPSDPMDLTTVFQKAQQYNQRMKLESDREKTKEVQVETYEDYESLLKKMLGGN